MPRYNDDTGSDLPDIKRFITTHDEDGKATFYAPTTELEQVNLKFSDVAAMHVHYSTTEFPVRFGGDQDLNAYLNPCGPETLANKNGTVARMVDIKPGSQSPMHRTESLDYGLVLEGEIDLVLEDFETGPVRHMRRGDVSVQRGTMHAWRNTSPDKWCRMFYVLVDAELPRFGDKELKEDLGGIELPK
ncbi:hypothetical protein LTR37_021331 [Vermiconidia calcicola]|uniref:Uncharacterized protein n=1 Tax=Vermiconidia calcicola TaxID=1690605 RepID=A0ACC3MAS4_9PEZI|nr:hypothetical protein LTR37_021331 [Vermiconidia calcicola]